MELDLDHYFQNVHGVGVMASSDAAGVVDTAIYSRPHVQSGNILSFIMRDRLTHKNLQENDHANYLFLEAGKEFSGYRFFLTKIDESTDHELIQSMTRRNLTPEEDKAKGQKFLVRFQVDKVLHLVGGDEVLLR